MNTAFLIDGFNFYHSIENLPRELRWFDYYGYCRHFLKPGDTLHSITYFTALAYWRPNSVSRHEVFIEACKEKGLNVILGKFKPKKVCCPSPSRANPPGCPQCPQCFALHTEKATDVNIALHAYRLASQSQVEKIVFVSGDTNLIPAVKLIKEDCRKSESRPFFLLNAPTKSLHMPSMRTIVRA
ncbi:MAG: NYN domain-containing protein [Deltaproteobacteria bacterium]|nr:NYN domain-containing protein [Deltaproteobacteria bacterium]